MHLVKLGASDRNEQRIAIKFCFLLGKTANETLEMLQLAFKESCLPTSTLYRWYSMFKDGRKQAEDYPRSGHPITAHTPVMVEKIREMIAKDRRLSVRMIADELGIGKQTVHDILVNDLKKRKTCSRIVPKILSINEKTNRKQYCAEALQRVAKDPTFINRIVTGDETWVFAYEPETKRQSMEWRSPGSPVKKIARMSKSKMKCMLITFFDAKGLLHYEFVPEGETVNQKYYMEVLQRLFAKVRRKRSVIWKSKDVLLLHDNARPHVALSVKDFLVRQGVSVLLHPPYSPDLSPCDFYLFSRLKKASKGQRLANVDKIKEVMTRELNLVTSDDYTGCFASLVKRWRKCLEKDGDYFE